MNSLKNQQNENLLILKYHKLFKNNNDNNKLLKSLI